MTSSVLPDAWRTAAGDEEPAEDRLICEQCGAPLGDDPDDDPAGSLLCGECDRNRNMEADLGALDAQDGAIDGMIDW